MHFFRPITLTWWQTGIFKLSLLAFGTAAGSYWNAVFAPYLTLLVGIGIVASIYVMYVWWQQQS